MATTVLASFLQFLKNIEVTNNQGSIMAARQGLVRTAIESRLNILDSFLTGSYVKDTMIGPLSAVDIDVMIVLSPNYHKEYTKANLLLKVQEVLQERFPNTSRIRPDGQAVTIKFSDFSMDIVPCFNRIGGGYLIPDLDNNSWISTNPKLHAEYKTEQNIWHRGNLVPVIKMMKCWNRNNGYPFRSFYLEMLVIKILKNTSITDFPSAIYFVLDKGREQIKYTIPDIFIDGNPIGGFKNIETVDAAVSLFSMAYSKAVNAMHWNSRGDNQSAIYFWRELFGHSFPIYG